jgi:hypothetical protein
MAPEAVEMAREMIKNADALTCTVEPMREIVQQDNSNVAIIPNYFDMFNYEYLLVPPEEAEMRWKDRKRTTVGYIGAANHTEDQEMFFNAMVPIMRERKDVDIDLFGTCPTKYMREFGESRIHLHDYCSLDEYPPNFRSFEIDILCNPLVDDQFNHCKSNIKWTSARR